MENYPRYPQRPRPKPRRERPEEEGCVIEVKNTRSGKKIKIGKNCTKDQIKMLQDSGQIESKEIQGAE